ncbi:hypothetical protein KIN20_014960 [Parelaphostrongylus tenuis]|uniref:Endonuclease/exonuclease/phosphatase domain-containing protein n=1 Tax=Parelaphostrongylus tenuis TaxID=148309 RepID=A0AAD5QPJ5_PARTN|nr:hypothetical protein KIN20_014960 [Parelaphostrongylus tenuis]
MIRRVLVGFLFSIFISPVNGSLRIMTFNIWVSGAFVKDGLQKIARHIAVVNPDIVALQEVESAAVVNNLTSLLGNEWTSIYHRYRDMPDVAIITKHEIQLNSYTNTSRGIGVRILIDSWYFVNMWSVHLDYLSYGPYAAYNKLVTSMDQIMAGENPKSGQGRQGNMEELKNNSKMATWIRKSKYVPVIVAGDFNTPSHLDWTVMTKRKHGGWSVMWPATKIMSDMHFIDSYRELHPNADTDPGYTWSTVNKFMEQWDYTIPEPQDRIDYIFYQGDISPIRSFVYAGSEPLLPIPHQYNNDYPSDHYAVVTDFDVKNIL